MTYRERDGERVDVGERVLLEWMVVWVEEALRLQHVAALTVLHELAHVHLHRQI